MTINNLLYGDERLSFKTNNKIILEVQQFILASKRFTNKYNIFFLSITSR
jgi:hypothetical protein